MLILFIIVITEVSPLPLSKKSVIELILSSCHFCLVTLPFVGCHVQVRVQSFPLVKLGKLRRRRKNCLYALSIRKCAEPCTKFIATWCDSHMLKSRGRHGQGFFSVSGLATHGVILSALSGLWTCPLVLLRPVCEYLALWSAVRSNFPTFQHPSVPKHIRVARALFAKRSCLRTTCKHGTNESGPYGYSVGGISLCRQNSLVQHNDYLTHYDQH